MSGRLSPGRRRQLARGLAWLAFYLTVHFNVNDEHLSFWEPMKFVVAGPLALFSAAAVYAFGRLFARPLDAPLWQLLLYAVVSFGLMHLVYYCALRCAQPLAPPDSVTHRRWAHYMAGPGPFYFLRNGRYLLTVSPFFYFSLVCLPLTVKLLGAHWRENRRLAAAQRRWQTWEVAALRTRLHPAFLQQTLGQVADLLQQRQPALAAEVTLKLAQVLRHTLYAAPAGYVALQPELDAYLDYLHLQELRLPPPRELTVRLTVEDAGPQQLAAGILLPLTEHWLGLGAEAYEVEVRVRGGQLTLELRADPVPPAAALLPPLVEARLRGCYGSAAGLWAEHSAAAANLRLALPLAAPPPEPQSPTAPLP
jgi:hypothetical protein